MGNNVLDGTRTPVAYEHITGITTAKGITKATHPNGRVAIIQAVTADVNWRDDGTDPTAAVSGGNLLAAGDSFLYVGNMSTIKFINTTGGSGALVNVNSYK